MTDATFTAEHRSWQWELMLQFEDGSLPPSAWNEATLAVVAGWYAQNLSPERATERYHQYYHRNRRRLEHRLDGVAVDTQSIAAMDDVWESLLIRLLNKPDTSQADAPKVEPAREN